MPTAQSNIIDINYRIANISDCKDIYNWENDISTRAMSKNTALFSYASHVEWFEKLLLKKDHILYVALNNNIRIAFIRFEIIMPEIYEASIILNPIIRGKGLSSKILTNSIDIFLQRNNSIRSIKATIKDINILSKRCFQKCGFTFERKNNEYCIYYLIVKPK